MKKEILIVIILACLNVSFATAKDITVTTMNNCQGTEYSAIGDATPSPGNVFIVAEVKLENHGYQSFSVDPADFVLSTSSFNHKSSPVTYYLDKIGKSSLPVGSLPDGGNIDGYIAFEVPQGTSDYKVKYDGWEKVNLEYNCG